MTGSPDRLPMADLRLTPSAPLAASSDTGRSPIRRLRSAEMIVGPQLFIVANRRTGNRHHALNCVPPDLHRRELEDRGVARQLSKGEHREEQRPEAKEANSLFLRRNGEGVLQSHIRVAARHFDQLVKKGYRLPAQLRAKKRLRRQTMLCHFSPRQETTTLVQVLASVSQDVRQLQRPAERRRARHQLAGPSL